MQQPPQLAGMQGATHMRLLLGPVQASACAPPHRQARRVVGGGGVQLALAPLPPPPHPLAGEVGQHCGRPRRVASSQQRDGGVGGVVAVGAAQVQRHAVPPARLHRHCDGEGMGGGVGGEGCPPGFAGAHVTQIRAAHARTASPASSSLTAPVAVVDDAGGACGRRELHGNQVGGVEGALPGQGGGGACGWGRGSARRGQGCMQG